MPTGGSGAEYSALDSAMGGTGGYQSTTEASNRWRSYPNNFIYSDYWRGSGSVASSRGLGGSYWSHTAGGIGYARNLSFVSENVYLADGGSDKRGGLTVRCLSLGS